MKIIQTMNGILWGVPMLMLLGGTHVYFTIYTHGIQRYLGKGIRHSSRGFGPLATNLAATLGTGNIIGVSMAIATGGPGALLWCWLTGVLGMATTYVECYLGVRFQRRERDGTRQGGPMWILKEQCNKPHMARFYAWCLLLACLGVGCFTQSNALADAGSQLLGNGTLGGRAFSGLAAAVLTGLVIMRGITSISKICTAMVPILGALYLGGCLWLLIQNISYLPESVELVVRTAFSTRPIAGGILGGCMGIAARYGITRGLFTNEAGLGSASVFAATGKLSAFEQGIVSMTATFWDTVVMCGVTGLVIISHILRYPQSVVGYAKGSLTSAAFESLPFGGKTVLEVALIAFALATLIGWSYLGERSMAFLWGERSIRSFHLLYPVMIAIGAVLSLDFVWELTDVCNGLLILPNLYVLYRMRSYVKDSP